MGQMGFHGASKVCPKGHVRQFAGRRNEWWYEILLSHAPKLCLWPISRYP